LDLTITQYPLLANIELASQLSHAVLVRSLPLWEEAQRQFLSQFGTESLLELRALLTSAGSAVTNAFTADQEKP
jgi:hypothetical protein